MRRKNSSCCQCNVSLQLTISVLFMYCCCFSRSLDIAVTSNPKDASNILSNLPKHECFTKHGNAAMIMVTSFNARWYNHVLSTAAAGGKKDEGPSSNPWARTILETTFHYPLIVYHEEDLPDLPNNTCKVDLRQVLPWMEEELTNPNSGLNSYFNISTFFDPCTVARKGYTKIGHALMLKVGSINHAVQSSKEGTVVFWVDTDVTFRQPLPDFIQNWLSEHDVTYIPFFLGKRQNFAHQKYNSSVEILRSDERWRLETGLFALTANIRTRQFTAKALSLYRGGMYELAKSCLRNEPRCVQSIRVKYHVFLNDIFVFALLLHADLHNDSSIFHLPPNGIDGPLRHGIFAMAGLQPWNRRVWGTGAFQPTFYPVSTHMTKDIVTHFHIGKYIFHHFGYNERGVLSVQSRVMKNKCNIGTGVNCTSWRTIEDPGDELKSLVDFLGVPYMG